MEPIAINFRHTPNPCYGCEERYPGCHGECEKHSAWKEENNALRKKIYAEKKKEKFVDSFVDASKQRQQKRRNDK